MGWNLGLGNLEVLRMSWGTPRFNPDYLYPYTGEPL